MPVGALPAVSVRTARQGPDFRAIRVLELAMNFKSSTTLPFTLLLLLTHSAVFANLNDDLLSAGNRGDVRRIEELLRTGAGINYRSRSGRTALYSAARRGYLEAVTVLLQKGADPNLAEEDGYTPLHTAVLNGKGPCVRVISQSPRTNIDALTKRAETALLLAARTNQPEAVGLLLQAGANTEIRNTSGHTAWETSAEKGYSGVVTVFARHFRLEPDLMRQIENGSLLIGGVSEGVVVNLWWYETKNREAGALKKFTQPIATAHPGQRVRSADMVHPGGRLYTDSAGNRFVTYDKPIPVRPGRPVFVGYAADTTRFRSMYYVVKDRTVSMDQAVPVEVRQYLENESDLNLSHPLIQNLATRFRSESGDYLGRIGRIWKLVHERMSYDSPPKRPNTADQVYEWKKGMCGEWTRLSVALLRASGIPARRVSGHISSDAGPRDLDHTWPEAYLPGFGWLPVQTQMKPPTDGRYQVDFRQYHVESRGKDYSEYYERSRSNLNRNRAYFGRGLFVELPSGERRKFMELLKKIAGDDDARAGSFLAETMSMPAKAKALLYWMLVGSGNESTARQSARLFLAEMKKQDKSVYERYLEFSPSVIRARLTTGN